jgi:hypothetical protein
MAERAGEIPVRMTLIWDFGPDAPARWLRMHENRYAIALAARGGPLGFLEIPPF